MNLEKTLEEFLNGHHAKGFYLVYAKDYNYNNYCSGCYIILNDMAKKPAFKKITVKPKRKTRIEFVTTIEVK